jgi:hypothetical protein
LASSRRARLKTGMQTTSIVGSATAARSEDSLRIFQIVFAGAPAIVLEINPAVTLTNLDFTDLFDLR